jgi:nicotinamide-nucleotide amidase
MTDKQKALTSEFLELARRKNITCGFAESCTGGLLSSWITSFPGVSEFFIGSVVSYSNAVKQEVLQVHRTTLDNHGAVSAPTAKEMLAGVRQLLKVDVAAAITGIAGPTGGTPEKPVGLVFVATGGPGFERVERLQLIGDRLTIQSQSCERALELMIEGLQNS